MSSQQQIGATADTQRSFSDTKKPRFMGLQPFGLRAVALLLAVSFWTWFRAAVPHWGPSLWLAPPGAIFYSLLAAGALTLPRKDYLGLRFRWLLSAMIAVILPFVVIPWATLEKSPLQERLLTLMSDLLLILALAIVFRALKRFTLQTPFVATTHAGPLAILARSAAWVSRILSPDLLLFAGSCIFFYFAWPGDLSRWRLPFSESWITGELASSPEFISQLRDYAGRSVFALGLALSLASLVFAASKVWRRSEARPSHFPPYLALVSALLLGYSQLDAFFTFVELSVEEHLTILQVAWLLTTLVALAAIVAIGLYKPQMNRNLAGFLLLLGFPLLAETTLLLPAFAADDDYQIRVAAGTYISLALLAWGWLKLVAQRPTHRSTRSCLAVAPRSSASI